MKISVVTVSYNQKAFLGACIDSVAAQEGPIEHIICDPGSTDGSRDLIASRRDHFAAIVLDKDEGPADGLNKGFAHATGDIFYYLNSDDIVLPGAFAQAREQFVRRPGCDVIFGDGFMLDQQGNPFHHVRSSPFISAYAYCCGGATLMQQATFFRALAFRRAGGFNIGNRACWDGELLAQLSRSGAVFKHVPADWGGFRLHDNSLSGGGNAQVEERYRNEKKRMFREAYGREIGVMDYVARYAWQAVNAVAKRIGA